jgi:hypothetical protein
MATISPKELRESGLLYHINETALWPLGLALSVEFDKETGEYGPNLAIQDNGEVIQDPSPVIREKANQWLAERYRTVKP